MTLNNPKTLLRTAIKEENFSVTYAGTKYKIDSEAVRENVPAIVDEVRNSISKQISWPKLLEIVEAEEFDQNSGDGQ